MEDPEFCRAVEAELIKVGLRLRWLCDGTDRLNWRDVQVVILEADQGSAIARCELGESAFWTVDTHLLAGVLDALNGANFQRGGGRGKRPSPVPRPMRQPRLRNLHKTIAPHCLAALTDSRWTLFLSKR